MTRAVQTNAVERLDRLAGEDGEMQAMLEEEREKRVEVRLVSQQTAAAAA